jgi:GNAT superfamily N-acetyltransferase
MKVLSKIDCVRPLVPDDIPAVVELRRSFTPVAREVLTSQVEAFFTNPFYDPEIAPLVYDLQGEVVGMIGVIPRRVRFQDTLLRCAVSTHFLVAPDHQRSGIGNALFTEFLAGPQDLTYVDYANDQGRRAFEHQAGLAVHLLSLDFFRLLRPATLACSLGLKLKRVLPFVSALEFPLARRLRPSAPAFVRHLLDEVTFAENFEFFARGYALRPEYNQEDARWLFATLENRNYLGQLRRTALRNSRGELLGWYMYLISPRRIAELVHLAATDESANVVFDCLLADAFDDGCAAVRGRMMPRLLPQLATQNTFFRHGAWTMVHSKHKELLDAFHYGQAYMMYLDGEMVL